MAQAQADDQAQAHVLLGAGAEPTAPAIRRIGVADLFDALARGWEDFAATPTHGVFLCLIYPALGIAIAGFTLGFATLHLLFPLAAGFALIGPVAALGVYELSRRREAGVSASASDTLDVLRSPSLGAIVALGALLMVIFFVWIATARAIYVANFGYAEPASISQFAHDVLFTRAGWTLIVVGNLVGFLFAAVALTISAVSFPLLLDRDVGAMMGLLTSARVVLANPLTMALWGLIVAALLVIGSLPLFIGLAVTLPLLGHATWHLYRKAVEPGPAPRAELRIHARGPRHAADFPAVLWPWYRHR